MPLTTLNVFLSKAYPMSVSPSIDFLLSFIGAMGLYMYMFGYVKQFNLHRFSKLRTLFSILEIVLASTLSIIVEARTISNIEKSVLSFENRCRLNCFT